MLSKIELKAAIEELLESKHTIQNCEKLASIYTVLDHLYPENTPQIEEGYSFSAGNASNVIGDYGESEFLQLIKGRELTEVIPTLDELVATVQVLNPRLYASFIRKLDK